MIRVLIIVMFSFGGAGTSLALNPCPKNMVEDMFLGKCVGLNATSPEGDRAQRIRHQMQELNRLKEDALRGNQESQVEYSHWLLHMGPVYLGLEDPTSKECKIADNYLKSATKNGYAIAPFILGKYGCNLNAKQRFKLIKTSAELGYEEAFCHLGDWSLAGAGTKIDKIKAYMWYQLCYKKGFKDYRTFVGANENQRQEAIKMAKKCKLQKYQNC